MEEILKVVYRDYLNNNDECSSKALRNIREATSGIDTTTRKLREVLEETLFDEVYDLVYDSLSDVQEACFMAGFNQCANMMTNGRIDFFQNNN